MIVNLTENRFLQQVQKIELINWDWPGIHYAIQRKLVSKNVQLCNILPRNYLSYIFDFELVPFALSLILRDPFMLKGGETFSEKKKCFLCGEKLCGENLKGNCSTGTNDQTKRKEVSQNVFSSNLNTVNLNIFPNHGGISTSR